MSRPQGTPLPGTDGLVTARRRGEQNKAPGGDRKEARQTCREQKTGVHLRFYSILEFHVTERISVNAMVLPFLHSLEQDSRLSTLLRA